MFHNERFHDTEEWQQQHRQQEHRWKKVKEKTAYIFQSQQISAKHKILQKKLKQNGWKMDKMNSNDKHKQAIELIVNKIPTTQKWKSKTCCTMYT